MWPEINTKGGTYSNRHCTNIIMEKSKKIIGVGVVIFLVALLLSGCVTRVSAPGPNNPDPTSTDHVLIPKIDGSNESVEEVQDLTIHYLPQGYAILQSAGQSVLLGGCSSEDTPQVIRYLNNLGVERLNYIVVPNAEESRYGGVQLLMENIPAGLVVVPRTEATTDGYGKFLEDLGAVNTIQLGSGSSFNVGTCLITPVAPIVEHGDDSKDTSLILKATCENNTFLFPSDATPTEADTLLVEPADIKSDVLFINNRGGSPLPYSALRLIMPKDVIVATPDTAPDVSEFGATVHEMGGEVIVVVSNGEEITFGGASA